EGAEAAERTYGDPDGLGERLGGRERLAAPVVEVDDGDERRLFEGARRVGRPRGAVGLAGAADLDGRGRDLAGWGRRRLRRRGRRRLVAMGDGGEDENGYADAGQHDRPPSGERSGRRGLVPKRTEPGRRGLPSSSPEDVAPRVGRSPGSRIFLVAAPSRRDNPD